MQNLVYWACSKQKKKKTNRKTKRKPKQQQKNPTKQNQNPNLLRAEQEQGWPGGAWLVLIHTSPGGSQSLEVSGPNFSTCQVPQLGAAPASSSTHEEGAGSGVAAPAEMQPPGTAAGK